jgi:deoxyribonuclease-4
MIRFGPAGNSESFYEQGFKSSVQMPAWLAGMGLSAYEYQCGKGVRIREELASQIGEQAREHGVFLSIHAPYYINMSSEEKDKRDRSKGYVLETLQAAKWMGAGRIVVHTGSCSGISRERALEAAMSLLGEIICEADAAGFGDIAICPEVLGKHNQFGSLEEILCMCRMDKRLIPTIDFGHLHARSLGGLKTVKDFTEVLDRIECELGYERLRSIHSHFSRIEFTASGEKKHWTMADTQFGPEFEQLAEALLLKKAEPIVICESRGHMAEDALTMKHIYERVAGGMS